MTALQAIYPYVFAGVRAPSGRLSSSVPTATKTSSSAVSNSNLTKYLTKYGIIKVRVSCNIYDFYDGGM